MLEIFFLALAGGSLAALAKKRGGRGWPWVVVMLIGYLAILQILIPIIGPWPAVITAAAYIGMLFPLVILVIGGGRRMRSSWQCPNCQFFNEPTTLVCPCGYRPEAE